MGYSKAHTERVRRRILDSAGRLFRRHGFHGAAIDDIMADAGLTRGGFYAHFKSKEDLLTRVVEDELEFATRLREAREEDPDDVGAALKRIEYYLAPGNLKRVGAACTLAANASDLGRSSRSARKAFTRSFHGLVEEFRAIVAIDAEAPDERALAAVCTCVGALAMARAVTDPALAERLLASSRSAVLRELGYDPHRLSAEI